MEAIPENDVRARLLEDGVVLPCSLCVRDPDGHLCCGMRLIFAAVDRVMLKVGVLENIVVAGEVGGFQVANDRRGIGLLTAQSDDAQDWQEADGDRAGCPELHICIFRRLCRRYRAFMVRCSVTRLWHLRKDYERFRTEHVRCM